MKGGSRTWVLGDSIVGFRALTLMRNLSRIDPDRFAATNSIDTCYSPSMKSDSRI